MLEVVEDPVRAVTYERGPDDILMRGFKFAAAKMAAATALGMVGPHARDPGALVAVRGVGVHIGCEQIGF